MVTIYNEKGVEMTEAQLEAKLDSLMKYSAIAFDGEKQVAHLSDDSYSEKIELFIKENETKGFKVIVDILKKVKVLRNVYRTSK